MSDIKPGDLVVCVNDQRIACPDHPKNGFHLGKTAARGRIYRVSHIRASGPFPSGFQCGCGSVRMLDGSRGILARFRKLNDEPDNAEIVAKIKACKPSKVSA